MFQQKANDWQGIPYLEPETARPIWRGTVGLYFTDMAEFERYLRSLVFDAFQPVGIVLHNTDRPNVVDWRNTTTSDDPMVDGRQRLINTASGYRAQGWYGGPHIFATDTGWWVFNPPNKQGTHSPLFNRTHWSLEMAGNFDTEPFNQPPGSDIRDRAVEALAVMFGVRGLPISGLRLHKDDPAGHQDCPGRNVSRADMIQRIAYRAGQPTAPATPAAPPAVGGDDNGNHGVEPPHDERWVQVQLTKFGLYTGNIDGDWGRMTKAAIVAYVEKTALLWKGL